MPVTVAVRPSTTRSTAIPEPGWPTIGTRDPPTTSSARHRSPSLWTSSIRPVTVTSRHRWADDRCGEESERADRRTGGDAVDAGRTQARRSVGGPDLAFEAEPRSDGRAGRAGRQEDLDRAGRILDDDPTTGGIEEGRAGGDGRLDDDRSIVLAQGLGDRDDVLVAGRRGRTGRSGRRRRSGRPTGASGRGGHVTRSDSRRGHPCAWHAARRSRR